jgi:hypothetical protein
MEPKKDPAAVALGKRGGKARAAKKSAAELSEIGRKGARARWGNKTKKAKGK